jgi:ABC-type branched-subunit amino acid transport system ATPase component
MSSYRPLIAATGLRKSYGGKLVPGGIGLTVTEGTVAALPGPNGAGKTTATHILSTLIGADGGEVRVAGHDGRKSRTPSGTRSASPASPRWPTACSPARRTWRSWPTCATSTVPLEHGASRGGGRRASWRRAR